LGLFKYQDQHSLFKDDICPLKNQRQKKSPYRMTSISTGQVWSAGWRIFVNEKNRRFMRGCAACLAGTNKVRPRGERKSPRNIIGYLFIFSAQTTNPSSNQKTTFHL
jgi:hypothetical protein